MPIARGSDDQPFVIRRSRIQGRGGYARRDIRKGERIIEYVGERITQSEADRRYEDEAMGRHHTFLFNVNRRTTIDAAVNGNDARFLNHSCDPNCESIDEKGRIYIEAIRNIRKGDELTYDYAYARDKDTTEEDEQRYVCRCGAANCRGTILEKAKPRRPPRAVHHVAARQPHEHRGTTAGKGKPAKRSKGGAKRR